MTKRAVTAVVSALTVGGAMLISASPAQASASGSISVLNNCGRTVHMGIYTTAGPGIHAPRAYSPGTSMRKSGLTAGKTYVVKTKGSSSSTTTSVRVTIPKVGNKGGSVLRKAC